MNKKLKNSLKYFVAMASSLIMFNSCMVGPGFKTQRTEIDSAAVYRYDSLQLAMTDSVLNIKWWEMFNDPVLEELISIGLKENKDLLVASSRIEQNLAILGATKAEMWPSLQYNIAYQYGNIVAGQPVNENLDATDFFTGFGTLTWEIDFWGKFRRANEAARAELVASEYGKRTVQLTLISQIATTYYQILDFQWRVYISEQTLELRQRSLDIIEERYDKGIVAEIELNQSQIQRAIAAAALPKFERNLAQTKNALAVLLGRNPYEVEVGVELYDQQLPPDIPVGIPSMLMTRRPDLLQSENLLHAQNARIGVAVAQRFPAISVTGLLGVASTDLSAITSNPAAFAIGGSLLGPLFEFGKNKRRVELEKRRTEQALYEYENTVINAFREVEDALVEISTFKDQVQARREHVAAADNAQILSSERYDKGVTSYLELIESQRQAFQAELALSEAIQRLFNGYVRLYKALGGGWIDRNEETSAQAGTNQVNQN